MCKFNDGTTWELCPLEELRVYKGYDIVVNAKTRVREFHPKVIDEIFSYDQCKPGFATQLELLASGSFDKLPGITDSLCVSEFLSNLRSV